ncbi:MAG: acyltransferase [Burkholderiales bacterium]|nr:acyltransferase [Burkholderiales bacterium]
MTRKPPPAGAIVAPRRLDLDHLRNAAVLLLVVFHTARLFDAEDWHIKDASRYLAADLVVRGLNLFSMPLLFLLAGAAMALSLRKRSVREFAAERFTRLFVPLLAGCVLFVLPQVWIERHAIGAPGRYSPIDFDGGLVDFAPHFFSCCYPQANFSWHHLWFLAYLFCYSLALLPLLVVARIPAVHLGLARTAARVDTVPRLLLLGVPLLVIELLLRPGFPSTHALAGDWANHAHFVCLVVVGWWLARSEGPFAAAAAHWRSLLGAALALGLLWMSAPQWAALVAPDARSHVVLLARTVGEWLWLMALLGLAYRFLVRPSQLTPFGRYAMPFYVMHQTIIVALGGLWLGWEQLPWLKYLTIVVAAGAGTMLLCLLLERLALTRWVLGMRGVTEKSGPRVGPELDVAKEGTA